MIRNLIILPDGTEVFSGDSHDNAIISAKYIQTVNADEDITLGSVCANVLKLTLILSGESLTIAAGTELEYYTVADDGTREKIGLFTMEKPTKASANLYKVTAYDRISWLDKDLTAWLEKLQGWPYTAIDFAKLLFPACGLTLATTTLPNSDQQIRKFSADGITGRQLAKWLGEIFGRFCRANKNGEIEYAWYEDKGATLEASDIFAGSISYEDYQVSKIEKIQIQGNGEDIGTIYPDSTDDVNTYKITSNYLLTAETADELKPLAKSLLSVISGITYTPAKLTINAKTSISAGDIVHVTDRNGMNICVYVMEKTVSGQKATLECTGNLSRDSVSAVNEQSYSALYGKVLNVSANVEGLRIENADTAGKVAKLELDVDKISLGVTEATSKAEAAQASADAVAKDLNDYAENVAGSLEDLQNQIDGAIETWFYDYAPTTKNAPASAWTTTEDKNKHLGDLFYIVDNDDLGGQVYRWALVNGVYGWILVEDTEVAKALETASKAQDTADGKRRVFVAQPTPPYDVGDLWTDGADLRVCKTARTAGSYTASDWQLATEYIDESVAQAKADAAESNAKTYASAQIKVASDSILQEVKGTYTTKTDFSKAVVSVQEQYYRSVSSATTVGGEWSTSEPTWSEGIYVWNRRLVTYGDGTTGYEPSERGVCVTGNTGAQGEQGIQGIQGIQGEKGEQGIQGEKGDAGADGRGIKSTTTTYQAGASGTTAPTGTWTTSVPATSASAPYLWTRTITTYTDGTTSTAYAIGGTIEGVEIGGKNLVRRTSSEWSDWITPKANVSNYATSLFTGYFPPMQKIGDLYTAQLEIEFSGVAAGDGGNFGFWSQGSVDGSWEYIYNPWNPSLIRISSPPEDGVYKYTITSASNRIDQTQFYCGFRSNYWDGVGKYRVRRVKVERGNRATDWTPAPEDIDAEFDTVNDAINSAVERVTTTETKLNTIQEQTDERWAVTATKEEVETTVTKAVDSVQVGGRNLFLATGVNHTNDDYLVGVYKYADAPLTAGETYTATICVTPAENVTSFNLFFSGGYTNNAEFVTSGTSKQIISKTFTMLYSSGREPSVNDAFAYARFYRYPGDGTVTGDSTIHWVKIEKGNKATDWSPAPEDVDSAINEVNVKTINNSTKIESQAEQIALRATTEELNTAVSEQNSKLEAMLKVQSDAIRQEITKSVEQKIADGDDALAARYEEIRTYLDFTTDGLFLGKSGNDTIMHLINNALEILVAGVAATTVDQTGLTAAQANIKTLHMGNFTFSVSDDGNRLSLS